ncbi:MAG: TonB-dependent receptor, partial [Desulfosarcina sp.]|nr:TonB-dependent receptor [Desulfobacterales bacterium]
SFETLPVIFSFGLRGTAYSEFDNTVNPEARISYKKDKWSLSFIYSRTNNIPSFYQRYDKTGTKEPNPDLDMEIADNFSLSFFTEISPRLSFGVSLFNNRIKDRIAYVLGDKGIGRYENFGEVTYKGGDFFLNVKIMENLSLKTTYSYLKAINEDTGRWLTAKPRNRVYADLSFSPVEDFSIILNLKYESKQYTRSDNKNSVPERTIGNIRIEYSPARAATRFGQVEFFGEVKNIGDKKYLYGDGWLAPPRTWICGLNYRF